MGTQVIPTFFLKGINPNEVLNSYLSGHFTRPVPTKALISPVRSTAILTQEYGESHNDPVFAMRSRNNYNVILATSNHEAYQVFKQNGHEMDQAGTCDYCGCSFESGSVGYPLAYSEDQILVGEGPSARYVTLYTFWVEGSFCSYEDALGYVRHKLSRPAMYRDTSLRDTEMILKQMYRLAYPDAGPLQASNDDRLLRRKGGSLSDEEWRRTHHTYRRTDRVVMIPAKVEYIRQTYKD